MHPVPVIHPIPMACSMDLNKTRKQTERKILLESNDRRLPPLLEPVKDPPCIWTGSQAQFNLLQRIPEVSEDTTNISLALAGKMAYSAPTFRPVDHMSFEEVCMNPAIVINPKRLGFIPQCAWLSSNVRLTFGALVENFFRKRNSIHCKFPDKLYNALKLSEAFPEFRDHLGIQWVNDVVIRVHRNNFARLIGVKTVEGGLFHQQGNFPSHGFVELSFEESDAISRACGFGPCDLSVVRFVRHSCGLFTRYSQEITLEQCKWTNQSTSA